MDKFAAAAFLKVSIRTLERYVKDKKISVVYINGHPTFSEEELTKFKAEKLEPIYKPALLTDRNIEGIAPLSSLEREISAYYQVEVIKSKKLLTLKEAAKISGLSVNYLKWHLKYGKLKARKLGRGWFVHPKNLDDFIDNNCLD